MHVIIMTLHANIVVVSMHKLFDIKLMQCWAIKSLKINSIINNVEENYSFAPMFDLI